VHPSPERPARAPHILPVTLDPRLRGYDEGNAGALTLDKRKLGTCARYKCSA